MFGRTVRPSSSVRRFGQKYGRTEPIVRFGSSAEPEPELLVRFGSSAEPEPELLPRFGSSAEPEPEPELLARFSSRVQVL